MNYTAEAPAVWEPAFADAEDCLLSADQCVVRGQHYFVVHTRPVGERPFVELKPTDHPLAVEQRTGISPERVREIASALLHAGDGEPR
ncbi:DUF2199 domain-containing protein [Streptomyces sp. NBC_00525]|uniref:DUF2199 domain-containing protein n=1 Tax=Streptomyces sp. NBC_00525 TaxID=2903660 RepID=UPI002E80E6FD|nr:DUF2199 domain-containing protein [Streptomyces sp. NBC_00525]WUC97557.1 DUF2199 domain-containing protein [Streptomyces sp. NBC_00525]